MPSFRWATGAIQFLADSRDALFPNTPVVFYTAMPLTERMDNSTGIVNVFRLDRTIELALALQPDLRQLFVVTGAAAADRQMEQQARADFERFKGRLDISTSRVWPRASSRHGCRQFPRTQPSSTG